MKGEEVTVGYTCGHNTVLNTKDARDEAHFKQMIKIVTMNLCKPCLKAIEDNQSDKGKWT